MLSQSLFAYETWVHATAGATGSIFATAVFYPLEIIKFRLQLEDDPEIQTTYEMLYHILKTEGFNGLYRGMKPVLESVGASNFVYFYTFHGLKSLQKTSTTNDLVLGIIAGIVNVLATTPLWVVNSRLKVSMQNHYRGLLDGLIHIANTEGLGALWAGLGPSLVLVINPAIQFTIYEALKRNTKVKTAGGFFFIGACAKAIATVLTYPIQLIQTRKRHGHNGDISSAALLLSILKRKGPKALFQGLEAKLLQTVLTAALMLMTYEKIARFVFMILLRNKRK